MRVVFLDVDGVLNSQQYFQTRARKRRFSESWKPHEHFDPLAIDVLNEILHRSGAKVVLSSTWRLLHTVGEVEGFMGANGFRGDIVGKTPDLNFGPRGNEIQMWLDGRPSADVESFVIIDDDRDMLHLSDRAVFTDNDHGLLGQHVPLALDILEKPWNR